MAHKKHSYCVAERLAEIAKKREEEIIALKTRTKTLSNIKVSAKNNNSFESISRRILQDFGSSAVRDISTLNRSLKSKDPGKIRLLVATHLFGKYKVPNHLEDCWIYDEVKPTRPEDIDRLRYWLRAQPYNPQKSVTSIERDIYKEWFITVARGDSLYKKHLKGILTRNEVHAFLTCPISCTVREAIIFALAKQWTNDLGTQTRIMKSKINTFEGLTWITKRTIWREVIHFFGCNRMTLQEMNDLIDYFIHIDNQSAERKDQYSLKGRNIHSLTRQMIDWHHELARVKRMGNKQWEGIPIADETFTVHRTPNVEWSFTQIKNSKDLAREGTTMHHCVYGYQPRCVEGLSSIWSVKYLNKKKHILPERALTLEISQNGIIVQVRGFANRPAKPDEKEAVKIWARKNQLEFSNYSM